MALLSACMDRVADTLEGPRDGGPRDIGFDIDQLPVEMDIDLRLLIYHLDRPRNALGTTIAHHLFDPELH
jgi:hypothetical protein